MTIKGILWHSTGANNPNLKRYIQPSDKKPSADTYSKAKWLEVLGTNNNKNDMNHINREMGMNAWIGKLADGTVAVIQTMPWDYRPWGCASGKKGSCNDGWIQFEICEDNLIDEAYFKKVYKEACELTAYLCKMFDIDPNGTVTHKGLKVPTILCHQDSYSLGLGNNHSDIYHWFPKYGKDMETARADVAKLLKDSGTAVVPTTAKTYKVVTSINKYTTSTDAIKQKNKKGILSAGTYYIYNKYPEGYKGVYNISTDKTGTSAGSWINPKENVIAESIPVVTEKLYRVRKSKDDVKSQKGAYSLLDNAKDACQEAGTGYHVFDWNWKIVYSYETKAAVIEPVKVVAVYDLDYPEKTKIIDKSIKRTNTDCTKVIKKILANNKTFDAEIAKIFFSLAPKYGIDPMMAIAQSIIETGWFKYEGSAVSTYQHNYCGLGVTSNGIKGTAFSTIAEGVTAQLQHLYAYGCKDALPSVEKVIDPRFSLVTRGIATYWQQLAGRWACPGYDNKKFDTPQKAMEAGDTYGQKILTLCNQLKTEEVTTKDVEKYFPTKVEVPKEETEIKDHIKEEPEIDTSTSESDKDNPVEEKATGLARLFFECIKKIIQLFAESFSKGE